MLGLFGHKQGMLRACRRFHLYLYMSDIPVSIMMLCLCLGCVEPLFSQTPLSNPNRKATRTPDTLSVYPSI